MITLKTLDRLREAGLLSASACRQLSGRPAPHGFNAWLSARLLALGAVFMLCAAVFFFAHNWDAMGKFLRLSLPLLGLLLCGAGAYRKGLETTAGQAFAFGAAVFVGVFMAVFGQTYQTGAFVYELFLNWALLIVPLALLARNKWMWLLDLYVFLFFLFSYFPQQSWWAWNGTLADPFLTVCAVFALAWLVTELVPARGTVSSGFKAFVWVPFWVFLLIFGLLDICSYRVTFQDAWLAAAVFTLTGGYALLRSKDVGLLGGSALGLVTLLCVYLSCFALDHFLARAFVFAVLYAGTAWGVYLGYRFMKEARQ